MTESTPSDELARIAKEQAVQKVHGIRISAGKWNLGKALCGCTISRNTPTSNDPAVITCPRCLKNFHGTSRSRKDLEP